MRSSRRRLAHPHLQAWPHPPLHAFHRRCPVRTRPVAPARDGPREEDVWEVLVRTRSVSSSLSQLPLLTRLLMTPGTVVADIAKSRAEIESSRLLVLSAALQVMLLPIHAVKLNSKLCSPADRQSTGEGCAEGDRYRQGTSWSSLSCLRSELATSSSCLLWHAWSSTALSKPTVLRVSARTPPSLPCTRTCGRFVSPMYVSFFRLFFHG